MAARPTGATPAAAASLRSSHVLAAAAVLLLLAAAGYGRDTGAFIFIFEKVFFAFGHFSLLQYIAPAPWLSGRSACFSRAGVCRDRRGHVRVCIRRKKKKKKGYHGRAICIILLSDSPATKTSPPRVGSAQLLLIKPRQKCVTIFAATHSYRFTARACPSTVPIKLRVVLPPEGSDFDTIKLINRPPAGSLTLSPLSPLFSLSTRFLLFRSCLLLAALLLHRRRRRTPRLPLR